MKYSKNKTEEAQHAISKQQLFRSLRAHQCSSKDLEGPQYPNCNYNNKHCIQIMAKRLDLGRAQFHNIQSKDSNV